MADSNQSIDPNDLYESDEYFDNGDSIIVRYTKDKQGNPKDLIEIVHKNTTYVPKPTDFNTSGWSFRQIEVKISLQNTMLSNLLNRTRELGYIITKSGKDVESFKITKNPSNQFIIERRDYGGEIVSIIDDEHCENSASDLCIKLATKFGGTLKGILIAHDNYEGLGMYPVAIINGKNCDVTSFKVGVVKA